MAWIQPLPPPRVDRHDRVVADTDREMVRLTEIALDRMRALTWDFGEVDVEPSRVHGAARVSLTRGTR